MTYGQDEVVGINLRSLALGEKCPVALGPETRKAKPHLDRWQATNEVCLAWLVEADKSEDVARRIADGNLSWMDPVQRAIVEQAFAAFRRMFPDTDPQKLNLDVSPAMAVDPEGSRSVSVHAQFEISESSGDVVAYRLKTGRPRPGDAFATTEDELAIIAAEDAERTFNEVRTIDGVVEPLALQSPSDSAVAQIFKRHSALMKEDRSSREPGLHCLGCARPSTCEQYPAPVGVRPRGRDRALIVTKSRLPTLDQCERRVAWASLYGIPRDDGHDTDRFESRHGRHFHEAAAAAILADEPDAAFKAAVRTFPESEASDLLGYWDQHQQLTRTEEFPVSARRTEYPLGGTWVVPGPDINSKTGEVREDVVAVVLLGFADVVGREASGLPAVIDHKTGTDTVVPYETELYAVGAALLLRTNEVAIHRHQLTLGRSPRCERVQFDADQLRTATDILAERAARIAAWHPSNALDPSFQVNPSWCSSCEFEERCSNYRVVTHSAGPW
jgi:hypothetical protein